MHIMKKISQKNTKDFCFPVTLLHLITFFSFCVLLLQSSLLWGLRVIIMYVQILLASFLAYNTRKVNKAQHDRILCIVKCAPKECLGKKKKNILRTCFWRLKWNVLLSQIQWSDTIYKHNLSHSFVCLYIFYIQCSM